MKLSKFLLGTAVGLAAGVAALYYKQRTVEAPARRNNTRVFDDFSAVDLDEFGDQLSVAAADPKALVLAQPDEKYVLEGRLTTPEFELPAFKDLVVSWNALTPVGTEVEVSARVNVSGRWSKWHSWGRWSTNQLSGSVANDVEDSLAGIDTDTLTVKTGVATRAQLSIRLRSNDQRQTPVLKLLAASVKPVKTDLMVDDQTVEVDRVISAPAYSQEIRDPKLAPGICSPTTISMAVNRQNADILPEEAALRNYDTTYDGFGNWSFSTAMAGSLGYRAYTAFTDLDGLRREIAKGFPVGVSVQYTNDPNNGKLPYVEQAPGDTYGHLLLVTGFTKLNGVDMVTVNDSYADHDDEAKRFYRLDQFSEAWHSRVAYFVGANYDGYDRLAQPSRVTVDLVPDGTHQYFSVNLHEQRLPITKEMITQSKPFTLASTTVAVTTDGGDPVATTAQQHFEYADVDDEGRLAIDVDAIKAANPAATEITVYIARLAQPTLVGTIPLVTSHDPE